MEIDTIQQMQAIDKDLEKQVKCVGKIKESFTSEITRLRNLLDKRTFQKPKLRWLVLYFSNYGNHKNGVCCCQSDRLRIV